MDDRPLAIGLFSGLHGWETGLVAAGWRCVGFDIEDMSRLLGEPQPEHFHLVLQDVLTLKGSQFKDAHLICASPPCQFFSYTAMPWTKAKDLAAAVRLDPVELERRLALFNACFRIQREASEAAGRYVPMVVENVRGAIPWVGRSKYHYGSYHLWGDVPALMPAPSHCSATKAPGLGSGWVHPSDPRHTPGLDFTRLVARSEEDGRKLTGFRFDGSGGSFQTAAVNEGRRHHGDWLSDPDCPSRRGGQTKVAEGRKGAGAGAGAEWFDQNHCVKSSKSPARKAASARIAKIPFTLAEWIGRAWWPGGMKWD